MRKRILRVVVRMVAGIAAFVFVFNNNFRVVEALAVMALCIVAWKAFGLGRKDNDGNPG
jgi:hypothetical protein